VAVDLSDVELFLAAFRVGPRKPVPGRQAMEEEVLVLVFVVSSMLLSRLAENF
jgi:hypothetical protein